MSQSVENNSNTTSSPLYIAARTLSWIFSPLLIPAYGTWLAMWGSPLAWLPERTRWFAVLYTLAITGLFPLLVIGIMRMSRMISDASLTNRTERTLPYAVTAAAYLLCGWYFVRAHAPEWLYMFFAGGAAAIIIALAINLKWKISAHATAAGGLVAMVLRLIIIDRLGFDLSGALIGAILIAGLSGTSRLLLNRHTPAQVWSGYLNGFICTFIASGLHL